MCRRSLPTQDRPDSAGENSSNGTRTVSQLLATRISFFQAPLNVVRTISTAPSVPRRSALTPCHVVTSAARTLPRKSGKTTPTYGSSRSASSPLRCRTCPLCPPSKRVWKTWRLNRLHAVLSAANARHLGRQGWSCTGRSEGDANSDDGRRTVKRCGHIPDSEDLPYSRAPPTPPPRRHPAEARPPSLATASLIQESAHTALHLASQETTASTTIPEEPFRIGRVPLSSGSGEL